MKNSQYKNIGLEVPAGYEIPGSRMPGDPVIVVSFVDIDYKCFKKTAAEKVQLKAAKAQAKFEEMKRR